MEIASPALLASIASTYESAIADEGRQPLLFMLIAFGATFGHEFVFAVTSLLGVELAES